MRRSVLTSLAAAGVGLTVGYPVGTAAAATSINYMGWQGYDDATNVNGFLDKSGMVLQPTYMESQEQWIAAIRGGGRGNMEIGTPVDIYLPFTTKAGLFTALDLAQLPNMKRVLYVPWLMKASRARSSPRRSPGSAQRRQR